MSGRFYRGAQSETKKEADHSGKYWADDELAIIVRPDLNIKQAALILGRTYASVAHRRHLLRRHQRMTQRAEPLTAQADRPLSSSGPAGPGTRDLANARVALSG